jgi:hypothetical protein
MPQKYHRIILIYTLWEFQKNRAKKVKEGKVLAKARNRIGENYFDFFYVQKKVGHNSEPPKQTYY